MSKLVLYVLCIVYCVEKLFGAYLHLEYELIHLSFFSSIFIFANIRIPTRPRGFGADRKLSNNFNKLLKIIFFQVKIWFQNRRMKWRNSKERELLASGGNRCGNRPIYFKPSLHDIDKNPTKIVVSFKNVFGQIK